MDSSAIQINNCRCNKTVLFTYTHFSQNKLELNPHVTSRLIHLIHTYLSRLIHTYTTLEINRYFECSSSITIIDNSHFIVDNPSDRLARAYPNFER